MINQRNQKSFCSAKWLQTTIDLVHGTTHSCHHPRRHEIPIDLLADNPSALHNTPFKKLQRKKMLEGERPEECSYCWDIEDADKKNVSDRMIKNADPWSEKMNSAIRDVGFHGDINPTYLEVMLDNACQLSCSYCSADISSSIAREIKKYGNYSLTRWDHRAHHVGPYNEDRKKVFLKAFWRWLPDIIPSLHVLRITGGEPLISPQTFKIFDYLREKGSRELIIGINSNLSVSEKKIDRLIQSRADLIELEKIRDIEIYASLEGSGAQAEFTRQGLDINLFWSNLEKVASSFSSSRIVIMATYNLLSVSSFGKMLEKILKLKKRYQNIILDVSYLRHPEYLSPNLITDSLLDFPKSDLHYMQANYDKDFFKGFSKYEIQKFERIFTWMTKPLDPRERIVWEADFYSFVNEFSRRYNKNFVSIFPEMEEFYSQCRASRFERAFL